jgi:GTP-binding protein
MPCYKFKNRVEKMREREEIKNIAIIAHVDHGKTTLVDELLKQSGTFRANQHVAERVMDSNDIERERGITILSKNTAVTYNHKKINIIDTPGHADFGGEVERVLKMVDGVLLLVDAFEGPMPQTRFVLEKALALKHPVIVVINKIDRPDARPAEVVDAVVDLLIDLGAEEEQLDFPVVYASARSGYASLESTVKDGTMKPLFEKICSYVPSPKGDETAPLQMLVSTIDYSEYVGRIAIGKIERGTISIGQQVVLCGMDNSRAEQTVRVTSLFKFEGLNRVPTEQAIFGDIVAVSGVEGINIGDTICAVDLIEPLPFVKITEPTISMVFSVNNGPYAGREGKFVTSRNLRERLYRETFSDVSLRVEDTESTEAFKASGRGELHLSILIENMRREGYEFLVAPPKVIFKEVDGKQYEPMEHVVIDVPDECVGTVIEKLGSRKGEMESMDGSGTRTRLEFSIPSRGLFGYRAEFLSDTRGEGVMNTLFDGYEPYKGHIQSRSQGSLVAFEQGDSITYGLFNAQERGTLFIGQGVAVYQGMIVGQNGRPGDIDVNVCRKKQATNVRASGSDDSLKLSPHRVLSLEEAIEFIADDELVEITPKNIRMRKRTLDMTARKREFKKKM